MLICFFKHTWRPAELGAFEMVCKRCGKVRAKAKLVKVIKEMK
jgi:hypothetical protein